MHVAFVLFVFCDQAFMLIGGSEMAEQLLQNLQGLGDNGTTGQYSDVSCMLCSHLSHCNCHCIHGKHEETHRGVQTHRTMSAQDMLTTSTSSVKQHCLHEWHHFQLA
jgi:hypothetical protein